MRVNRSRLRAIRHLVIVLRVTGDRWWSHLSTIKEACSIAVLEGRLELRVPI